VFPVAIFEFEIRGSVYVAKAYTHALSTETSTGNNICFS